MEIILYIYIAVLIFRIYQQSENIYVSFDFFKKNSRDPASFGKNLNNKIEILIPVYQEKESLIKSLIYWTKTDFSPIFITTEREGSLENCQTCLLIQAMSNFRIIHSPNLYGFKASQLNYAIKHLNLNSGYYAIFDVDSRPDLKVFNYVQTVSEDEVIQLPSIFTNEKSSYYGYGSAIYQTRRVFTFEITAMLFEFSYLVGHGLFIRSDIAKKYPFCEKTLTEDLIYGYTLALENIKPKVIPFLDLAVVPNSALEGIKQGSRWFIGDFLLLKYLSIKKISETHNWLNIIKRYLHIFEWLFGSIGFFIVLIFGNEIHWVLLWIALIWFLSLHKIIANKLFHKKFGFKEIFSILFRSSINSLAPIYGIYLLIIDLLKIKSLKFERTKK